MVAPSSFVHATADVAPDVSIGDGAKIWHYAQVRERATIGSDVIVGRGAYVGTGVSVGDNCKIQNYALVYEPATLASGVFIGPAVVLTNDQFPRAINPDGTPKSAEDWQPVGVDIAEGASVGANSTCIAPLRIGQWALVGAGSTVVKDVPDFALVAGVPARRLGWVGSAGQRLVQDAATGDYVCPLTSKRYREVAPEQLIEVEDE